MTLRYESECVACGRTVQHVIGEDDDPVCEFCGRDFCSDACRQKHQPTCGRVEVDTAAIRDALERARRKKGGT